MNSESRTSNMWRKLGGNYITKIFSIFIFLLQILSGCDLLIPLKPTANIKVLARISDANQRALAVGIEDHYGFCCYWDNQARTFNLDIYDLKNPSKPKQMSTLNDIPLCEFGTYIHNILIRENFLYINSPQGLVIIDVNDKKAPTVCATFPIPSRDPANHAISCRLTLKDPYLFLADYSLRIFDVTDKSSPQLFASYPNFRCEDLEVVDSLLYLSSGGVRIISISDMNELKLIAEKVSAQHYYGDLAIYHQYIFITNTFMEASNDFCSIYSFDNEKEIKYIGQLVQDSGSPQWMSGDLRIYNNKAYIGGSDKIMYLDNHSRNLGLYVFDISDLENIDRIAYFETSSNIIDIAVKGIIVLLAMEAEGFLILQTDF